MRTKYDKDGNVTETITTPYTVTGLALALGTNRETLLDYEDNYDHKDPLFSDVVKKAKMKCSNLVETGLLAGNINPIGAIFVLKNNFKRWKEDQKQDIKQTIDGNFTLASLASQQITKPKDIIEGEIVEPNTGHLNKDSDN